MNASNRIWAIGPQLAETLIDGGLRRAQLAQARAAYDITVDNYRQTVLSGFGQVEDQLVTLRFLQKQRSSRKPRWPPPSRRKNSR